MLDWVMCFVILLLILLKVTINNVIDGLMHFGISCSFVNVSSDVV